MIDPLEKATPLGDAANPLAGIEVSSTEQPADIPDPALREPLGLSSTPKRIVALDNALRALERGDCTTARGILAGLQRARPQELLRDGA